MRGIFSSSVLRDRAERQIAYRREMYVGVIQNVREVVEGTQAVTVYDVLLPGQTQPIVGVYNAAGYSLAVGDGVTLSRIKGLRFRWQIISRAIGVPVDLRVAKHIRYDQGARYDSGAVYA